MRKIKDYPIGVRLSIHILIIILLISLATISISGYFFNQHFNLEIQHDNENKLENTKEIVQILSEKALGIASTISEMELVKKAYEEFHKTGDLEKSRNMLIDDFTVISDKLSEELGIPARIHFHLPPARSMLRCWNGTGGDDLTSFRNTILEVSKSKKSVLGIEVGRAGLVIRGLSPIFSFEGEFVGSVEYMFPFSVAKQYLVSDKYELAFFIRKDISDDIRFFSEEYTENDNHQKVKYKILDSSSENVNLDIIYNSLIDKDITDTEMFKKGNYDYVMDPIYDFDNNIVGLVVYQEDISTYKAAFIKSNTILIGFVSLLAIISIFTIILIIRKIITNPLKLLSKVSKRHSLGDAKQEIDYYSENEVGVLASAFRELQSSMHIITNQAKTVSSGDYSTEIKPRSEKDELSIALNDMTKSLRKSSVEQKNLMAISEKLNIELQQVMNATSPLCAIDTDFNITRVNESFCDLFEKDAEKVIGEKCYNVINNEFCNTEKCVMKRILNSKNKVESISSCNLKNGNVTDLNIQSLPLKDNNDELIGIVENIKDITESVRAEKEIKSKNEEIERKNWLKTGQNELNELMSGDKNVINLSRSIITFLVKYVNAQIGTVYLVDETKKSLVLTGSYAYSVRKNINSKIKFGEGLVGQSAFEKEMITLLNVPDDYIRINSSLGDAIPKNIIVSPFIFEDKVLGVIELGSIEQFSEIEMEFIRSAMENIAIAVNSSISRVKLKDLLQKTQLQSEELQAQQEELRAANEELEEQTEELKASTEKLKTQQEELKATNEELEEKTESLERQSKEIKKQNKDIEKAKNDIENKAEDLAIASKYKSEFLANMSHELRTPLNSLLILSKDLADNTKENLTNRQVESAEIIYKSGNDLLHLINEILDLSKIEAGKITINIQEFMLHNLVEGINRNFKHLTDQKGLDLNVNVSSELDGKIVSDQQRIEQIIKNLISNAIKFTQKGSITIDFKKPTPEMDLSQSDLQPENSIAIVVSDTGIGIPKEKLGAIFEAFQQADGSTSRKFGGTGLGLSISRELTKLLGGELQLISEKDKGSTFTIILPKTKQEVKQEVVKNRRKHNERRQLINISTSSEIKEKKTSPHIEDDRYNIEKNDRKILVIEDDLNFARTLHLFCNNKEFKFIHAGDGESGLELAKKYIPDAIILDIKLPGMNGWEVLEIIKNNPAIRHIPVHMMSAMEEEFDTIQKGAVGYLTKPITNEQLSAAFDRLEEIHNSSIKKLLVVEDNKNMRTAVINLLGDDNVEITAVDTGQKALAEINNKRYDCMILDITLPDISGLEILQKLKHEKKNEIPPVIIYTGKEITKEEELELNQYTGSIIIKGIKSEERLLDETALFLHQVVNEMPKNKQKIISRMHDKFAVFQDKKILVVDDDMRNVFAVSHVLEEKGMIIQSAGDGQKAIEILEKDSDFDLVLMDIMMPVMDGYEAMRYIRKQKRFKNLVIIALTAKAMKGDKEQCITAGANDYLTKPLQIDKLLSILQVWMYK